MRTRTARTAALSLSLIGAIFAGGCSDYRGQGSCCSTPVATADRLTADSQAAIQRFRDEAPELKKFFDSAYAWAVYPEIAKGGAGIGAANGMGSVFERGALVGTSELTQVTLGFQLGGQTYSEIIFFQDKGHFDVFKDGDPEFAANASVIGAKSGSGATNDVSQGVAAFILPGHGFMFEAVIGGQSFKFTPLAK